MPKTAIGIISTGSYVPADVVTSARLAEQVGASEAWILERTRIRTRRYAEPGQATSDLAVQAARRALDRAGVAAESVDFLLLATSTPDSPQPPTSYRVQARLGMTRAACIDVNVACSGFVSGLALARGLLADRPGGHALVVAADVCSRALDPADRRTAVLMGDGAGAALLGPAARPGLLDVTLVSRGEAAELIRIEAGGSREPASPTTLASGGHFLRMQGRDVAAFLLRRFPPFLHAFLEQAGVTADEVAHFIPHQPNGALLDRLVERVGLPNARVHRTVEEYGNTAAAAVPLTLDLANRDGLLAEGDLVLLAGFGSGMSMSAAALRWGGPG
jgi:acetoacetyl-CoA synthase